MGIGVSRAANPMRFDTGIGRADYAEVMSDPASGSVQKPLMPGATTVTQAIDALFPSDRSVAEDVTRALVADSPTLLRTSSGFGQAARDTLASLRGRGTDAADAAAREIASLLADVDLFEHYRMALLET